MSQTTKSSIYTRGGDFGETSLADGSRVRKDALRVEAYGAIDELCSWVGLVVASLEESDLAKSLTFLQHRLYNCSSNIAALPGAGLSPPVILEEDVASLEAAIDLYDGQSGPIRFFILPGGTSVASLLHVARTVCRRAERRMVALAAEEPVDPLVLRFVNRASDLLFAAARYANLAGGGGDIPWNKDLPPA